MNTNRYELRIGVTVLAAIVCLVLMTIFFGKQPIISFRSEYIVQVRFQQTPGIKKNSPVCKNGVQIGRVSKFELVDQDREVEITLALNNNRRVYTNEQCRIRQSMLLGETTIEIVKVHNFTGKVEEIDPAIPLVGVGSGDIISGFSNIETDLSRAIASVSSAAENIGGFVERINGLLGSQEDFDTRRVRLETLFNETRATMSAFRGISESVGQYVNDPKVKQDVRQILDDLPVVLGQGRTLVGESTLFVQDARKLVEKSNASLDRLGNSIETLAKLSEQVGGDAPEIIAAVKKTAEKLSLFFDDLTVIMQNAQQSDGTLKRLMRDPSLYEKLLATLDNAEKIMAETDLLLRTEVKPIAGNIKLLTDKAARDPSIFIRNLLKKEPPVKNLPYWGDGLGSDDVIDDTVASRRRILPLLFMNFRRQSQPVPIQIETIPVEAEIPVETEVIIEDTTHTAIPPQGRIVAADPRYSDIQQVSW